MMLLSEAYGEFFLDKLKREIVEEINERYPNNFLPRMIEVEVSSKKLPPHKIAAYNSGLLTIHPKALADHDYSRAVLTHELIHAAFKEGCCAENSHHWGFQKMADDLGLPEKYRD